MAQWEYCTIDESHNGFIVHFSDKRPNVEHGRYRDIAQILGELGQEGWELVSAFAPKIPIRETCFVLKRPLQG